MILFIYLLLQILVFMPVACLAAESGKIPLMQNRQNTDVREAQKAKVIKTYDKLPLYFIENKGQVDKQVSFYERGAGHATFFTKDGVVLSLTKSETKTDKTLRHTDTKDFERKKPAKATTEAVRLSFVGANEKVKITAQDKMPSHVNYFVGNDKTKWRSNIPTYGTVTYKGVYKNIDIKFYGNNKNIEHDVIVKPGGVPSVVQFTYKGIKGLKITEEGDLEVSLNHGNIIEKKPVAYQEINGKRVAVAGKYRILKGRDGAYSYGFQVASYDKTKDLIVDPVLVYSTYLGGSDGDVGLDITVDDIGATYVTGYTFSSDFPLVNPMQGAFAGYEDAFITKINPAGSAIVYSTYLGGSGSDIGWSIAVDSTGAAYVMGETWSSDFPLVSPIQGAFGGGFDAFITKINPTGSAIIYSTYLGGSYVDSGSAIAVDSTGAAYVTGDTYSLDFPLVNPIQGAHGGGFEDTFVTKLNPAGTAFVYSTYLGGAARDVGHGIAVDSTGAAYVTGDTNSTDFPLVSPIQATHGGEFFDAFITKINPAGVAIIYSTYLGGSYIDYSFDITVDSAGSAYVTGETYSVDFPIVNPIQGIYGGFEDAFITKINPAGSTIIYSTYLGGDNTDVGYGIAVDTSGTAYISGTTWSTNYPLVNPIQSTPEGISYYSDAFVTIINPTGSSIIYSTSLGGNYGDNGRSIAIDSTGSVYITGDTSSPDFPTMNPIYGSITGASDAFISKISLAPLPVVTLVITPDATSIARGSTFGYTVTATNTTATTQCFNYWENVNLPNGSTYPPAGALFGPVHLCLPAGTSLSGHLTHGVPMSAPLGTYTFNAFTGAYPAVVVSEAHFNFNVTAFNPATKKPQTSWRLIENGFRR